MFISIHTNFEQWSWDYFVLSMLVVWAQGVAPIVLPFTHWRLKRVFSYLGITSSKNLLQ